jgi:hypothetical protein
LYSQCLLRISQSPLSYLIKISLLSSSLVLFQLLTMIRFVRICYWFVSCYCFRLYCTPSLSRIYLPGILMHLPSLQHSPSLQLIIPTISEWHLKKIRGYTIAKPSQRPDSSSNPGMTVISCSSPGSWSSPLKLLSSR